MNQDKKQIVKVLCGTCNRQTNHEILFSHKQDFHEEMYDIFATNVYQIVQCQGCDDVSFRVLNWCSESDDQNFSESLYPERTKEKNQPETIEFRQYDELPLPIDNLYRETIGCFKNCFFILCAAGVRALIEGICLNKNINGGTVIPSQKNTTNLEKKINGLTENGILTKDNANILHVLRYLGNEAIHELSLPTKKELLLAIRIIEHILDDIYEFPVQRESLKNIRSKKGKKTIP
jgi:hypothetical protein